MPETKTKAKPRKTVARPAVRKAPAGAAAAAPPKRAVAPRSKAGSRAGGGGGLTIEQYRSGICCIETQKRTLRALGLRHPHHRVVRPDNAAIRGMVKAIPHLVRIVEG
jgi:large subunit ribosomal protein L30